VSTAVKHLDGNEFEVTGDLTIKGITKSLLLSLTFAGAATDTYGNPRIGFEGSTTINRKDFGVTWNAPLGAGGVLVGDKVILEFDISAIKTA
jgi:polyisoprenoid-binding protein YceI